MAVNIVFRGANGITGFTALSTDTLPNATPGSWAKITDSGAYMEHDGQGWVQTRAGGKALVSVASDYRGPYPSGLYVPLAWVTDETETAVTGLHNMHSGQFKLSSIGVGETISVQAIDDGGTEMGYILVEQIDHATPGTKLQATALAAGTYKIVYPLTCAALKFVKSATSANTYAIHGILSGA